MLCERPTPNTLPPSGVSSCMYAAARESEPLETACSL